MLTDERQDAKESFKKVERLQPEEWTRKIIEIEGKLYLILGWWRFQIPDLFSKYLSDVLVVEEKIFMGGRTTKVYKLDVKEFFVKTISYEDLIHFLKVQEKHKWTEEHYALFFSALFSIIFSQRCFSDAQIKEVHKALTDIIETGVKSYFEERLRRGFAYGSYDHKIELCYKILNDGMKKIQKGESNIKI